MTRQERRNQIARDRGFSSAYAERVAKGASKGLTARQAVGKAPRPTTGQSGVRGAPAPGKAPLVRTQTAAGTVYSVRGYNVGRLSTIIANLGPSRRIQFVITDSTGRDHPLYSKGGRYAGVVRYQIAAEGSMEAWLASEADSIGASGGSEWTATDVDTLTMTVLP